MYAHKKAWQRVGDSLVVMSKEKRDAIIDEVLFVKDWSAQIVNSATIDDLSQEAILKARKEFKKRNPKYESDVDDWDDITFLNKAKLTIKGKITNSALILLGKEEEEHLINPAVAKVRWNLRTVSNQDKDFEIFSMPLILSVDSVLDKIRNIKYRYLPNNTLFPEEMLCYDPYSIRELLHNCIAHQDYTKGMRINVVEFEDDRLVFTNGGAFIPKSIEDVINQDAPEVYYRNPHLVEAMRNLNMIETQGGGIRRIFNNQRLRAFPMPDYELTDSKVKVVLTGKIINQDFARILANNPSLSLQDIMLLDKVQKGKELNNTEIKYLRSIGFIEGRKGALFLSSKVIIPTDNDELKAQYVRNRSFDDNHFKKLITEYIIKYGSASRKDIDLLLKNKLSDTLTERQKRTKIDNLLRTLRKEQKIINQGVSKWELFTEELRKNYGRITEELRNTSLYVSDI